MNPPNLVTLLAKSGLFGLHNGAPATWNVVPSRLCIGAEEGVTTTADGNRPAIGYETPTTEHLYSCPWAEDPAKLGIGLDLANILRQERSVVVMLLGYDHGDWIMVA